MSKRKKIILIVASVLTLFIVFKAVQVILRKPTRTEYLVPVKVIKPVGKDVEEIINLTGDVRGLSEAKVYSKVPGKLQKKKKDVGDLVSKNEVVALVDRDEPALKFKLSEV
ncbi:MAG: hypothetical protein Q7K21_03305, partial [Elusimicrobiota bacterium]|nr:hypothetical protein [Elusimicrobiota bacterium]